MRYSTYQSIYEPVNTEAVKSNMGLLKKRLIQNNAAALLLKLTIVSLIVIIGCSAVLTVFAGDEENLIPGGKVAVSQGETLWSISLEHKPENMDTRVYIEAIKEANQLQTSSIQVGQVLELPRFK